MSASDLITATVYSISDKTTGEIRYVGKTSTSLTVRLQKHIQATRTTGKQYLHHWLRSINFNVCIAEIESVPVHEIDVAEKKWIAHYRSMGARLTNIRDGGEGGGGFRLTEEQRAKISESNRRRFSDPKARERMAECNRINRQGFISNPFKHTPESRAKLSALNSRPKTDAEKQAMSRGHLKRLEDPEQRRILIARIDTTGKTVSPETRAKQSAATKGTPKSEQTKIKMKAAWVLRRAKAK